MTAWAATEAATRTAGVQVREVGSPAEARPARGVLDEVFGPAPGETTGRTSAR